MRMLQEVPEIDIKGNATYTLMLVSTNIVGTITTTRGAEFCSMLSGRRQHRSVT